METCVCPGALASGFYGAVYLILMYSVYRLSCWVIDGRLRPKEARGSGSPLPPPADLISSLMRTLTNGGSGASRPGAPQPQGDPLATMLSALLPRRGDSPAARLTPQVAPPQPSPVKAKEEVRKAKAKEDDDEREEGDEHEEAQAEDGEEEQGQEEEGEKEEAQAEDGEEEQEDGGEKEEAQAEDGGEKEEGGGVTRDEAGGPPPTHEGKKVVEFSSSDE